MFIWTSFDRIIGSQLIFSFGLKQGMNHRAQNPAKIQNQRQVQPSSICMISRSHNCGKSEQNYDSQ